MVAVPNGAERTVIHPNDWTASPNPYSYAISTGDTLFLSGLVPRNGSDNTPVGWRYHRADEGGHGERRAAAPRGRHGLTRTSSVRASTSRTASVFPQMNAVYGSYFKKDPASARDGEGWTRRARGMRSR